jgi:Plavaka transposase
LPATIQDVYQTIFGKAATAAVLTHLKRELMHAIWDLIIDEPFMDAYENGIIVRFFDGILRRIFPRFYTYSADYPEK